MQKFFKDLKVVELAGVLAGPATGFFFAELGAKVIKVENKKTGGDVTRSWKLPSENKKDKGSAYFYSVNLLKKVLSADLSVKSENEKIRSLIREADVLIVNFKKGDDRKFGLTYAALKKTNPRLIYASVTGFGDDDARVAYDLVLQAESGFMSMNGTQKSGPVKMPVALIDLLAAHQLKEGILLALLQRMRTGRGSKISVSLYDAALASLANQASNFLNAGYAPGLQGSLHPNIAPYGELFFSRDKKLLTFAVGSDAQFKKLCALLSLGHLAGRKEFADNASRVRHRKKLQALLAREVRKQSAARLLGRCVDQRIPAAQVRSLDEVLSEKRAASLILERSSADGMKKTMKSFVCRISINK